MLNLIVLIARRKDLSSISYIYLRGLAVADFLFVAMWTVWLMVILGTTPDIDLSLYRATFNAHFCSTLMNTFNNASNLCILFVTLDRYLSICHPLRALYLRSKKAARLVIASIFLLSALLHIPEALQYNVKQYRDCDTNKLFYKMSWNEDIREYIVYKYVWPWSEVLIGTLIPVIGVCILNPMILRSYRKSCCQRLKLCGEVSNDKSFSSNERGVTVLLLVLSLIFVVTTFPSLVAKIIVRTGPENLPSQTFQTYQHFTNVFEIINYSVNFYLYNLANVVFRKNVRYTFVCGVKQAEEKTIMFGSRASSKLASCKTTHTNV